MKPEITPGKMDLWSAFWFVRDRFKRIPVPPMDPVIEALEVIERELHQWNAARLRRFSATYDAVLASVVNPNVVTMHKDYWTTMLTKAHELALLAAEQRHGPERPPQPPPQEAKAMTERSAIPTDVEVHSVIQLDPESNKWKQPLLCIVTELKSWGVQCMMPYPDEEGAGSAVYLRVKHGEYVVIGKAEWAPPP